SDDRIRFPAERNRFPENVRITREPPTPKAETDQSDFPAAGYIFLAAESTTSHDGCAKKFEVIRRNLRLMKLFGYRAARIVHNPMPDGCGVLNRRLATKMFKFGR